MPRPAGYMIKQIYQLNQIRLNHMFAQFDLTASQTFTMVYLFKAYENNQAVNQKDIEEEMDISNPTVTGILNRLQSKGLIERITSKEDARVKNIRVTNKALKMNKELRIMFNKNEAQLISCLEEHEKEQLSAILEKILVNMQ